MTRFSESDLERIVTLREQGWTYQRIGQEFGVSGNAISYYCLKLAADPPKPAKCWNDIRGPSQMTRNGFVLRRFTSDDDTRLLAMEAEGKSLSEIGKAMGRRHNSIKGRLMTLARREERQSA